MIVLPHRSLAFRAVAGGGTITFVNTSSEVLTLDASQIETTAALPGSLLENDFVVAMMVSDATCDHAATATAGNQTLKTTGGWTQLDAETVSYGPGYVLAYKKMGVTPDTTLPYFPSDIRNGAIVVQAFRGVDTSTPLDVTYVQGTHRATGATSSADPPSITTITDNAWVLAIAGHDDDELTSVTDPSGYTNGAWINAGGGAGLSCSAMMASKEIATAGAEDPGAFALSHGDSWRAMVIALRPA